MQKYFSSLLNNRKFDSRFLVFLFFAQCFVALVFIFNREIWVDEAYTLTTSSHPLKDITAIALKFDSNPPLFFLLLAVWKKIFTSIFMARVLTILLIGLASVFFYKTLRLFFEKKHAVIYALLHLLNPFVIFMAINIRYYALSYFLSILLIYLFIWIYFSDENKISKSRLILLSFIATLGVFTQFQISFLLFTIGASLVIVKGWKPFISFLIAMVAPFIVVVLMVNYLVHIVDVYSGFQEDIPTNYGLIQILFLWGERFLGLFHLEGVSNRYFYWGFRATIALFMVNFLLNKPIESFKKSKILQVSLINVILLLIVFLFLFVFFKQSNLFMAWHLLVLAPFMLVALSLIIKKGRFKFCSYTGIIILLVFQLICINKLRNNYLSSGFSSIIQYIDSEDIKFNKVHVFPAEDALIAKYLLETGLIVSLPVDIDFYGIYGHHLWLIKSEDQLGEIFNPLILSGDTVHLIKRHGFSSIYNVGYNVDLLHHYLGKPHINVLSDTVINKLKYISFTVKKDY